MTTKKKAAIGSLAAVIMLVAGGLVLQPGQDFLCPADGIVYHLEGGLHEENKFWGYPDEDKSSFITCELDKIRQDFVDCENVLVGNKPLCSDPEPVVCQRVEVTSEGITCL